MKCILPLLAVFIFYQSLFAAAEVARQTVSITVEPKTVLIEKTARGQLLSFDFLLENPGAEAIRVSRIELSVFGRSGALQLRKFLTSDGLRHGDYEIVQLAPKAREFILNPFEDFAPEVELARLQYDFFFETGKENKEFSASVTITPQIFAPKTILKLPLKGKILVHDGHDFFSHHRRFNLAHPFLKEINVTRNFTRFASDFCIVNEKGDLRRNKNSENTVWYGFGADVYSPGAGRIVRARNSVADNINGKSTFTLDEFRKDPTVPAGNFVIIDHMNGEFSLLAHLKQGSVAVKEGDTVKIGQKIGQMGVSGDAYLPHVHYELRSASTVDADAFPAYFQDFVRLLGSKRFHVKTGPVNSGDLLESR
jgi:hypothetical protein